MLYKTALEAIEAFKKAHKIPLDTKLEKQSAALFNIWLAARTSMIEHWRLDN